MRAGVGGGGEWWVVGWVLSQTELKAFGRDEHRGQPRTSSKRERGKREQRSGHTRGRSARDLQSRAPSGQRLCLVIGRGARAGGDFHASTPNASRDSLEVNVVALPAHPRRFFLPWHGFQRKKKKKTGSRDVSSLQPPRFSSPGPFDGPPPTVRASLRAEPSVMRIRVQVFASPVVTRTVLCPGPTHTEIHRRREDRNVGLFDSPLPSDHETRRSSPNKDTQAMAAGRAVHILRLQINTGAASRRFFSPQRRSRSRLPRPILKPGVNKQAYIKEGTNPSPTRLPEQRHVPNKTPLAAISSRPTAAKSRASLPHFCFPREFPDESCPRPCLGGPGYQQPSDHDELRRSSDLAGLGSEMQRPGLAQSGDSRPAVCDVDLCFSEKNVQRQTEESDGHSGGPRA